MKKAKRILALAGVILLLAMYGSTMVFAFMKDPRAGDFLMASIYCTIAVPVLLYAMTLVTRRLKDKNKELQDEAKAAGNQPEKTTDAEKEEVLNDSRK